MLENFNTKEKEDLLLYYMVINDLGKSKSVIEKLKSKGIESIDHDELLTYLVQFNMLPSLSNFSDECKKELIAVLDNGINVGQYIQGENVDYSFDKVLNLNNSERTLMMAEAMLDIGGVTGHTGNFNGSLSLNQSTVENILLAERILSTCQDKTKIFGEFLSLKANWLGIENQIPEVRKAIVRICLMMRLYDKNDVKIVENEIVNNLDNYKGLIYELSRTGYEEAAILPYYSPALLANTNAYYGKDLNKTMKTCLPFLQRVMTNARNNSDKKDGIITVMLRDAAEAVKTGPEALDSFDVDTLNDSEATVKKR